MKTMACWSVLLWMALVLENTRPDLFPDCSLTVPVSVGCILWVKSGSAIALAGLSLIGRWLLQPSAVPIEIVVVILSSAWLVLSSQRNRTWTVSSSSSSNIHWALPVTVVAASIASHAIMTSNFHASDSVDSSVQSLAVAIPVTIAVQLFARMADEFGLRRTAA